VQVDYKVKLLTSKTDVSEELSDFFIRLTRIGELGTGFGISSQRASVASYS
jgi:hypothetical protein